MYPVPHAYEGARPLIDWAVMQDPFGNEFCLVRGLTLGEREALAVAAEQGPGEDAHWHHRTPHDTATDELSPACGTTDYVFWKAKVAGEDESSG